MSTDIFDIDAAAEDFKPIIIRFRGEEHILGGTVFSLLNASSIFNDDVIPLLPDDDENAKDSHAFTKKVFEFLRPILRALSPTVGKAMDRKDLTPPEEAALLKPATEALNTLGRLSFRTEEEGGEPDEGADSEVPELLPAVHAEESE